MFLYFLLQVTTSLGAGIQSSVFYGRKRVKVVTLVPANGNVSDIGSSDDSLSDADNDPEYIPPVIGKANGLRTSTSLPDDDD